MGRRIFAGACQLTLSVAGFVLLVVWMFHYFYRVAMQQLNEPAPRGSYGWLAEWGAILFVASWIWALVTSISLLRQTKDEGQISAENVPPRISEVPQAKSDASD